MLNSNTAFSWLNQVWIFRHSNPLPSSFLSSFRHLSSLTAYRNGWVVAGSQLHPHLHCIIIASEDNKHPTSEDVWGAHPFEKSGSWCESLSPHKWLQDRGHPEPPNLSKPQEDCSMVRLRILRPQSKSRGNITLMFCSTFLLRITRGEISR